MRRCRHPFLTLLVALLLVLATWAPAAFAAEPQPQDLYTARTQDGVDLVLKRYRPGSQDGHNAGAQPLILMPGILCNHNFFDVHVPEGGPYGTALPEELAPWAQGDRYLQTDPMKYYSLAYYLWSQGYDVWLANYRGEGRDPVRSGGAAGYAIDELAVFDMPAVIEKVYEVTGKHPVWIGHSMGSTMAYMYLQGARFGWGLNPNVVSDAELARERNGIKEGRQTLKGLVDLDGPVVPGGCIPGLLRPLLYGALALPIYLDLRPLTANLGGLAADPLMGLESLLRGLWGMIGYPDMGLLNLLLLINPENMDSGVSRYFFQHGLDGVSTRVVAQFADAIEIGRLREDYRNGLFNSFRVFPTAPHAWDGYYYYSDPANLRKISLPSLVIADSTDDITRPGDVRGFYEAKGRNGKDAFYEVPDTAHVDLVIGLNAPTELFPRIGDWLKGL
ncbi:MAG: alpha/beta hydrolase [Actinobacteria bacterium]|nr:alpha/beta hydrolase [Actinomycetota bacterium]